MGFAALFALLVVGCGGIVQTPADAPDAAPDACVPHLEPVEGSPALFDENFVGCDAGTRITKVNVERDIDPTHPMPVAPADIPRTDIPIDHVEDGGTR